MSCEDAGEYNDFQPETFFRARKEHQCDACHETIRRGDRYLRTNIGYEGAISTYKHCLRCNAIAQALWKHGAGTIDMNLNCGHTWEENELLGKLPDDVAALAFLTADEAQALLAKVGGEQ